MIYVASDSVAIVALLVTIPRASLVMDSIRPFHIVDRTVHLFLVLQSNGVRLFYHDIGKLELVGWDRIHRVF